MTLALSGPIGIGTGVPTRDIADEFSLPANTPFPSGFYGLGGAPVSGPLSFADFYGRSGVSALSAGVDTQFASGGGFTSEILTGAVNAIASGGTAPYSYAWATTGGDAISPTNPASAGTLFQAIAMSPEESRSATFVCTITDSLGATADTPQVFVEVSRS